jgi:hypothetical protein
MTNGELEALEARLRGGDFTVYLSEGEMLKLVVEVRAYRAATDPYTPKAVERIRRCIGVTRRDAVALLREVQADADVWMAVDREQVQERVRSRFRRRHRTGDGGD